MKNIYCLHCGSENPGHHLLCARCGSALAAEPTSAAGLGIAAAASSHSMGTYDRRASSQPVEPFSPSRHAARRYPALRFLAAVNTVLAYAVLLIGGLFAGVIFLAPTLPQPQKTLAAVASLILAAGAFLYFLLIAEGIAVVVDIEANTRRIVHLLEKSDD